MIIPSRLLDSIMRGLNFPQSSLLSLMFHYGPCGINFLKFLLEYSWFTMLCFRYTAKWISYKLWHHFYISQIYLNQKHSKNNLQRKVYYLIYCRGHKYWGFTFFKASIMKVHLIYLFPNSLEHWVGSLWKKFALWNVIRKY